MLECALLCFSTAYTRRRCICIVVDDHSHWNPAKVWPAGLQVAPNWTDCSEGVHWPRIANAC